RSVRSFTSMRWQVKVNFLWDVTLYVTTAIAMVSGVLVSMFALPEMGIKLPHDRFWASLHVPSSEWLMAMVGIHLALHWDWIKTTVVRLFTGSLGSAGRRDTITWWLRPLGIVTAVSLVASVATGGLGLTPIATAMRNAPPRRAAARPATPAASAQVTATVAPPPSAAATAPSAAPSAAPAVATTAVPGSTTGPAPSTARAGAPQGSAPPAAVAPPRPRPKRPPMSFPRRVLRAAGILGRWVGIPFVLAMIALAIVERNRQASKGSRNTRNAAGSQDAPDSRDSLALGGAD
ncbi:MAG TPA: DUF4405 domain-containing protein, partial [Gemmatimonadaceae bacterium]|nr:DUF4405 domain-containing protein [Gemmatimonadaceae bacterium]